MSFAKTRTADHTIMTLTRCYRFSSSHRLHCGELGAAENARLYGKCNNPFGHGHDYVLEITVTGPVDASTGLVIPITRLDNLVRTEILQRFANRNLNLDVPEFAHLVPTTENVVCVIARVLSKNWHKLSGSPLGTSPQLYRIHLQETERNTVEVLLGPRYSKSLWEFQPESVTANV